MITLESHSKQIKLLNDYIGALQKQINTCKAQNQMMQHDLKNRKNQDQTALKNQNGQLRYQIYRQEEQLKNMAGLEKDYLKIWEQTQADKETVKKLQDEIAQAKNIEVAMQAAYKEIQSQLDKRTKYLEEEIRLRDVKIEGLYKNLHDQRTQGANNLRSAETRQTQTVQTLRKQIEDHISKYNKELQVRNQNARHIKDLVTSLNQSRTENIRLRQQLTDVTKLQGASSQHQTILSQQLEALGAQLIKTQNELREVIKRQDEEIQQILKDKQYFNGVISQKDGEIQALNKLLRDLQEKQADLKQKLTERQKALSLSNNEIQISTIDNQNLNAVIARLNSQKQLLINGLKTKEGEVTRLKENIARLQKMQAQTVESKDAQTKDLYIRLKDMTSAKQRLDEQLQEKGLQINKLKSSLELQITLMKTSQVNDIRKIEAEHEKQVTELKQIMQRKINETKEEVQIRQRDIEEMKGSIKLKESKLVEIQQAKEREQERLNQVNQKLKMELRQVNNQIEQMEVNTAQQIQGKDTLSKQLQLLRQELKKVNDLNRMQNEIIKSLNQGLSLKQEEIDSMQSTNSALRKQVITACQNQDKSRKELIDTKKALTISRAQTQFTRSRTNPALAQVSNRKSGMANSMVSNGKKSGANGSGVRSSNAQNSINSAQMKVSGLIDLSKN